MTELGSQPLIWQMNKLSALEATVLAVENRMRDKGYRDQLTRVERLEKLAAGKVQQPSKSSESDNPQ